MRLGATTAAALAAVTLAFGGTAALAALVVGTSGDDALIKGTARGDDIYGLAGDDGIDGLAGDDYLVGDGRCPVGSPCHARDNVDDGDDVLNGRSGDDDLIGNGGDDLLIGFSGHDRIVAGPGVDTLIGGSGFDQLDALDGAADRTIDCDGDDTAGGGSVALDRQDPDPRSCTSFIRPAG